VGDVEIEPFGPWFSLVYAIAQGSEKKFLMVIKSWIWQEHMPK